MASTDYLREPAATRGPDSYPRRSDAGRKPGYLGLLLGLLPLLLALLIAWIVAGGDDAPERRGATGSDTSGSLTAAGQGLLPQRARLVDVIGQQATGRNVRVQAVNGNEGFWVGSGAGDRAYVEWGGDVGENEASGFQPRRGQRVNLVGPVEPAPKNAGKELNLDEREAAIVSAQGAFVNADRVQPVR